MRDDDDAGDDDDDDGDETETVVYVTRGAEALNARASTVGDAAFENLDVFNVELPKSVRTFDFSAHDSLNRVSIRRMRRYIQK